MVGIRQATAAASLGGDRREVASLLDQAAPSGSPSRRVSPHLQVQRAGKRLGRSRSGAAARVQSAALTRSAWALALSWRAEPIRRHPVRGVHALDAAREHLEQRADEPGVAVSTVTTPGTTGAPSPERGAGSGTIRAAPAAVSAERIGTAWTLPERWSACAGAGLKPVVSARHRRHREARRPVDPDHAAPARGEGKQGRESGCNRPRRPTQSALVHWQTSQGRTKAATSCVWAGQ